MIILANSIVAFAGVQVMTYFALSVQKLHPYLFDLLTKSYFYPRFCVTIKYLVKTSNDKAVSVHARMFSKRQG
jgi:hypothetical protein